MLATPWGTITAIIKVVQSYEHQAQVHLHGLGPRVQA